MSERRCDEIPDRAAGGPIGPWGYRQLAEALQTRDDAPEALRAAADCVEQALSAAVSTSRAACASSEVDADIDRSTADFSSRVLGALRAFAPWLGAEGRVLRRIAAADAGESVPRLSLISWSAHEAGQRSAEAYRRLLERGGERQGAHRCRFVDGSGDADPIDRAVATMLALSCFPRRRLGELLGFALAEACPANGLLFDLAAVIADGPLRGSFDDYLAARELAGASRRRALRAAIGLHLSEHVGERMALAASAIRNGVALYRRLTDELRGTLAAMLGRPGQAPADALAAILREKARFAQGYHHSVRVGDIRLDDWFAAHRSPADLLGALARSDWVDRDVPERSRLLALFDFGGPMFGVFDAAEREVLMAWLRFVARTRAGVDSPTDRRSMPAADPGRADSGVPAADRGRFVLGTLGQVTLPNPGAVESRGAFHRLVMIDGEPDALEDAGALVTRWLRGTARDMRQWSSRFTFTPERFDAWLASRYRPPGAVATPARPRLPRQAYVYAIEQMAPAVLVDGCWLQRAGELCESSPEVAERLQRIHRDELGDGHAERSHPVVYRDLLRSLGLELPAITNPAFAGHSGFIDAAFDLPVYMLGLSLAPRRWLPEILGLNLAIELSGLGAGYQRTARELEFWGIDPLVVRLHQSIDTLAGGHAALAREAILLHLDQVRALGGDASVQQHWRRIWCGYHSLRTVTRRFRRQLIVSYLWRTVKRRTGVDGPIPGKPDTRQGLVS
ncbi:MAG: iron-containing redox enzyme family protein [Methylotetracoccus sp.]